VTSPAHSSISAFIILLERRATPQRVLKALAGAALAGSMLFGLTAARAQSSDPSEGKFAPELRDVVRTGATPAARWARDVGGVRHVQAIVVTDGVDPQMTGVRQQVLQAGGSVHVVHSGLHSLTVQIPAWELHALAQRSDVLSVSPNREIHTTASMMEQLVGLLTPNVRSDPSPGAYSGLDGSGIGIAILDSGIMKSHATFLNSSGTATRVTRDINMLNPTLANWTTGVNGNSATSLQPGSTALSTYEAAVAADSVPNQDGYGHGTMVASIAAGRYYTNANGGQDIGGIAPNANLIDVKVINDSGVGTISDAIEGIEWVIYHAKDYNIKVINISLAADSQQSWQNDPLCVAVRSATAAGITVVAAAGNFGQNTLNQEMYGTISSPGDDPSVITVGAVNFHGNSARANGTVDNFSSRGPTRGTWVDSTNTTQYDNVLKPDLVAPGNKVVGAAATATTALTWNFLAANYFSSLVSPLSMSTYTVGQTQMTMSGTSIAAPAVAGAVALMLQANHGLTPPLIKAILQYTAQPLASYNLLEQGAGYLNVDGAIQIAKVLNNDVAFGGYNPGEAIMSSSKTFPAPTSTVNGSTFNWSQIAFAGGNNVVSGSALFTTYQPIWDARVTWSNGVGRKRRLVYWSGTGIPSNTYVQNFTDSALSDQTLITSGVILADSLVGNSDPAAKTGAFIPTATLAANIAGGAGTPMSQGVTLSSGVFVAEAVLLSESVLVAEAVLLSEGVLMAEGILCGEAVVMAEGGSQLTGFKFKIGGE
jgi:serine protease AprX